jgi:NADH:ubiquinone oxidoreductase subunit 2 (subunit N)
VKNIEINSSTVAITWQKLVPLSIAFYLKSSILTLFILITSAAGSLLQIKTKDPLEIIGASSIFNNGWSLMSTKTRTLVFSIFVLIYWSTVWITTITIKKDKILEPTKWKEKPQIKWKLRIVIANIGGFPPTAGFAAKAWLTTNLIKKKTSLLVLLIISATSINLYSYTKIFINSTSGKKANKMWNTKDKFKNTKIIMSSIACMFLIST